MNAFETMGWLRLFAVVAFETCAIVAVAFAIASSIHSAVNRRTVWRIALCASVLLLLAELTGVARGIATCLSARPAVGQPFSVRILPPNESLMPVIAARSAAPPQIGSSVTNNPHGHWWAASVWLGGCVVVLGRMLVGRFLLVMLIWRSPPMKTPDLQRRVAETAGRLGIGRNVVLFVSDGLISPAAFGIWRPCIAVPQNFKNGFTPPQQDAMLAHELAHLAARDPLWHFICDVVAALLWWNPAIWWARRRLHATSELAADESTLILENGPNALAECLVNFGHKLAGNRLLGSLGVMGFRSNLGQRVERLLNLRTGTSTGESWPALTKLIATVLLIGVVILTSGWVQSRGAQRGKTWSETLQSSWESSLGSAVLLAAVDSTRTGVDQEPVKHPATAPTSDASLVPLNGRKHTAEISRTQDSSSETPNTSALAAPAVPKLQEREARVSSQIINPNQPRPTSTVTNGRKQILEKLDSIQMNSVDFDGLPLSEVVKFLVDESIRRDPAKTGLNFLITPAELGDTVIRINPGLRNVRLADVLDAVTRSAERFIKYEITDYAVVFSEGLLPEALYTRQFKVDPNTFLDGLKRVLSAQFGSAIPTELGKQLRLYFQAVGVDLSGAGKSVFFNDRTGSVLVRAGKQDLETIEAGIEVLNQTPPQVVIKATFMETDADANPLLPETLFFKTNSAGPLGTNFSGFATNAVLTEAVGILTDPKYRMLIKQLERQRGADILASPSVTTLSGRQANVSIKDGQTIVQNKVEQKIPVGPSVDLLPKVLPDGFQIEMTIIAGVTALLDKSDNPHIEVRQISTSCVIYDGQTVVLRGDCAPDPNGKRRQLLVFVTATQVDSAGNRVHSDEQLPFARNSTPPQPADK